MRYREGVRAHACLLGAHRLTLLNLKHSDRGPEYGAHLRTRLPTAKTNLAKLAMPMDGMHVVL